MSSNSAGRGGCVLVGAAGEAHNGRFRCLFILTLALRHLLSSVALALAALRRTPAKSLESRDWVRGIRHQ